MDDMAIREVGGDFLIRAELRLKNAKLYDARMQLGMTQEEVGKTLGFSPSYVSQLERMVAYPTPERAKAICKFYRRRGIDISEAEAFPEWLEEVRQTRFVRSGTVPIGRLLSSCYADAYREHFTLPPPEETLEAKELAGALHFLIGTLNRQQAAVITARYGLDGDNPKTYKQIAENLGVSAERIRQVERRALRHLQHPVRTRRLVAFID